ncbi:hypothetical protein [Microbacterium jiangjiandongii]|uniref:hypothetical protein n=1 Tax=Microbacterium jiangjiandongii TaxID=3049071 RepID=UPI00214ABB4F|nr:hypothetical protein [Microbacterium sp. zg.Y843]MCR2815520.1 hypothetical protein [Microbacterium sp. zg.Y843]
MTRRRLGPIAALVTLAVLGGSGVAVAAWSASASLTATASAATPATTIAQGGALTTTYQYTGTSSTAVSGSLSIKNTGGTPLSYSLATDLTGSPALAQKTTLALWTGNCAGAVPADAVKTTLANPAPALPAAARSLASGASVVVCVATRIEGRDSATSNAMLQGQSVTAAFRVTGAVGTSWTATATTGTVTQSVYQLAAAGAVTCKKDSVFGFPAVELTWNAPVNRPAGAEITYEVVDTTTDSVLKVVRASGAAAAVTIEGKHLDGNGAHAIAIRAKEGAYGTTALLSATVAVERSGTLLISRADCA